MTTAPMGLLNEIKLFFDDSNIKLVGGFVGFRAKRSLSDKIRYRGRSLTVEPQKQIKSDDDPSGSFIDKSRL